MNFNRPRRRFIIQVGIAGMTAVCAGCGTVLHPERIGQTRGRIDWRIAALDGAGLLLFFVPGVIAFAIDFYQGTIFLPPEDNLVGGQVNAPLQRVDVPGNRVDHQEIEAILAQHVGMPVKLSPGKFRTQRIAKIDEFWSSVRRLAMTEGRQDQA